MWPLVWSLLPSLVLLILIGTIIFSVNLKLQQERKEKPEKMVPETPVIGTPTDNGESSNAGLSTRIRIFLKSSFLFALDDHMTLIAIECSFHEAEQEQGSTSESFASEISTKELIDCGSGE